MSNNPTIAALKARLESEREKLATLYDNESKYEGTYGGYLSGHQAATERLMGLIEKAAEMAEYYGGDQNKKIGDKRLWEILTYDDCGKKAREFLNMIKDEVRVK